MESATQLEFNLQDAINNPEKAKVIVQQVQKAFTELANSNLQALNVAKQSQTLLADYEQQMKVLVNGNINLADALKNVHIFLNSKKDLWKADKEVQDFMQHLSTWVVSSGAIKLGVLSEHNK
jgi:hypothetical protein